ncbi:MAG: membrane fusion protein (multidrug efflux system) [Sphingobacteriales bacterium]|jgi:membrane fusion protein (multidrug efflux system)
MRKVIIVVVGILLLVGSVLISNFMSREKETEKKEVQKISTVVFTKEVKNETLPVVVNATGQVKATQRIDLYSEVQGVMQQGSIIFKPGVSYSKGQTLLKITSEDFKANLQAQKSTFQNLVTSALADIQLDFPNSFEKWNSYVKNFDINTPMAPLPKADTDKEKLFITGRNISSTYYNVKNAEIILNKYTMTAPFTGVLTEALVNPGTLIRPGQKLGEFINPSDFELEVAVGSNLAGFINKGKQVIVKATDGTARTWKGNVIRINSRVDPQSQTVKVFIKVSGNGISEGMFLEAEINAKNVSKAYTVNRSLLLNESSIYVVKDGKLALQEVNPVYFTKGNVILTGLSDGAQVITKSVPGAFEGMEVIINKN